MLEIKKIRVDGEVRLTAYVDGQFMEEVDCNSQFTIGEAKEYLREKYS